MDDFTRKFNTAEDKDEQIHHILKHKEQHY